MRVHVGQLEIRYIPHFTGGSTRQVVTEDDSCGQSFSDLKSVDLLIVRVQVPPPVFFDSLSFEGKYLVNS